MNTSDVAHILRSIFPAAIVDRMRDVYGSAVTKLKVKTLLRSQSITKVEIGSGPRKGKDGWTTVDMSLQSDLYWDLRRKLPFPSNSISTIYSSHVLEHFQYRDLTRLLSDCYRVLKQGGEFVVCVPNAGIYLKGYLNASAFDKNHMGYAQAIYSNLKIDIVNYIAYLDGEHRHMFDEENLLHLLRKVGFSSSRLREFDPNLDLLERKHESIYAEAEKS